MFKLNPVAALLLPALAVVPVTVTLAADTGDAPDKYGLASHEVVAGAPFLGVTAAENNDPVSGPGADADAEDGVFAVPTLVEYGKAYTTNVFASNPGTKAATLVGWVDFDGNGRFDADEAAVATVPAGTVNQKFKLYWTNLKGITSGFTGQTYARFRISTDALDANKATGNASDGEVEDYTLMVQTDSDGDEIPDAVDTDNDNDGIPDTVEVVGMDSDGDGTQDYLDVDSDNDGIPDFIEAGNNPQVPVDTDSDGRPDYLDDDSNNDGTPDSERVTGDDDGDGIVGAAEGLGDADGDGILNTEDLDSDNDTIPDAVEAGGNLVNPVDTDGDGVRDFLDLDSDNDGITDIREASVNGIDLSVIDADNDGRVDSGVLVGVNGIVDAAETVPESGILRFALADSNGDGQRDYQSLDSDGDGTFDLIEAGGDDNDANGIVDGLVDTDLDGVPDGIDASITGGADGDGDGIDDAFDIDAIELADADGDGIADIGDIDVDGDGIVDGFNLITVSGSLPDVDNDGRPDFQDDDANGGAGGAVNGSGNGVTPVPVTPPGGNNGNNGNNGGNGGVTTGTVETGLSGHVGCSISSGQAAAGNSVKDPLFALLVAMGGVFVGRKRRQRRAAIKVQPQRKP